MCSHSCIEFGRSCLGREDVEGKSVIEVGALDVNGSLRSVVETLAPASYVGVDIQHGPGVDVICDANDLVTHYDVDMFDVVIASVMLEHVRDWRNVTSNLKRVLKPGGILIVIVPSKNFPYHGYPFDYWRYEITDMEYIFSDLDIEIMQERPEESLLFMRARKPIRFVEKDLINYPLHSILTGACVPDITDIEICKFKFRMLPRRVAVKVLPAKIINLLKRHFFQRE